MKYYKDSNNNIYAYELDGSQDHLIADKVSVTQAQVDAINAAKKQEYLDSLSYAQKRQAAYPSIADQLDTIYHQGLDAWKATILAVKEEFPK
jgi:hypothetical protein